MSDIRTAASLLENGEKDIALEVLKALDGLKLPRAIKVLAFCIDGAKHFAKVEIKQAIDELGKS